MLAKSKILVLLLSVFSLYTCRMDTPIDPAEVLETIQVENGFQVELVAMEPLVSDPVDMEIDEFGNVFIVEMHGYPMDTGGSGVIRQLQDTDQDGKLDQSAIYYEGLVLPTGIMRWKNGFIVTDPPDVLYLEDTDNDGKADLKEVILTGFALSNPQHNVNNPVFGLDNWIYLANEGTYRSKGYEDLFGDEGTAIHFPGHPQAPTLPQNAHGLNVRFNPVLQRLEMLSGRSQYGHTFDEWGHHFTTNNANHIYHEVIGPGYMSRNPHLPLRYGLQYIPEYGRGFDIYPITKNPSHQLLTDVGVITSSCGITWYHGGTFPEPYDRVTFIAEPTHNLIHTDVIYEHGSSFSSRRHLESRQFLASTDAWFRPVNFYIGPDGSLLVLDYYRKIIEHPEWMSEEVIQSGNLYAGQEQGRLFRISVQGSPPLQFTTPEMPGFQKDLTLVDLLDHPNIWWRRNAQRLLVDHQNKAIIPTLKSFIRNKATKVGIVHGMWSLDGLGEFDTILVHDFLQDVSAGVRENAIRLAEKHRSELPFLENQLVKMASDPDPKVRFQVLCTLGFYDSESAKEARLSILLRDLQDYWVQIAFLSGESVDEMQFIQKIDGLNLQDHEGLARFLETIGSMVARKDQPEKIQHFIEAIILSSLDFDFKSKSFEGLVKNLRPRKSDVLSNHVLNDLVASFSSESHPNWRSICLKLLWKLNYFQDEVPIVAYAKEVLFNGKMDWQFRRDAIKMLAWHDPDIHQNNFQKILAMDAVEGLHLEAIYAIGKGRDPGTSDFLMDSWKSFDAALREATVEVFLANKERRMTLLNAVKDGRIHPASVPWRKKVSLLNSRDDQVRQLARELFQGNDLSRDSTWIVYQNALELSGDIVSGADVFNKHCSICHQVSGRNGTFFGPDLATIRNRNKASILIDILQPNRSITDGFQWWTFQNMDGQYVSGIISNESINSITLRDASGVENMYLRSELQQATVSEVSAMPEGIHQQIGLQGMANLLEYLKVGN